MDDTRIFVGHAHSGKLYCAGSQPVLLASNANSFAIAAGFVIFATTAHDAQFVPVERLVQYMRNTPKEQESSSLENGHLTMQLFNDGTWEKRRVERGSRIVTVVPSTMSLVLQMPRGNLETINPRPLVMEVVKADLDAYVGHISVRVWRAAYAYPIYRGRWQKAFVACRKHRIDLSIIVQHNQDAFMAGVSEFVDQVQDVDYVNLFLTNVGSVSLLSLAPPLLIDVGGASSRKRRLLMYAMPYGMNLKVRTSASTSTLS